MFKRFILSTFCYAIALSAFSDAVYRVSFSDEETLYQAVDNCYKPLLGFDAGWFDHTGSFEDTPTNMVRFGCLPTMDTQSTGWDVLSVDADNSYCATNTRAFNRFIINCNHTLFDLNRYKQQGQSNIDGSLLLKAEGHIRALRAYGYFWMATTFGQFNLLSNDQDPCFIRVLKDDEMWNYLIDEFLAASQMLDWTPDKPYQCGKGMALAYLADVYMYKARSNGNSLDYYRKAKEYLKQIIESGQYELQPSYTTLWDLSDGWQEDPRSFYPRIFDSKESIFQIALYAGKNDGSWDNYESNGTRNYSKFYWASLSAGGWGNFYMSWELYDAFEVGDKRRDGSLVAAPLSDADLKSIGKEQWAQRYIRNSSSSSCSTGYNGFTGELINDNGSVSSGNPYFQFEGVLYEGYEGPTVWSTKYWRTGRAEWGSGSLWAPTRYYLKRYANVILDYAECCFRTGAESEGWSYVDMIRNRAFGNLEVGRATELSTKYTPYYTFFHERFNKSTTEYPYIFSEEIVNVPSAETYYANLKAKKGFRSETWKVAVNEERRKEFNGEPCLLSDIQKSGYLEDHIECNYPMNSNQNLWNTNRNWELDSREMYHADNGYIFMPVSGENLSMLESDIETYGRSTYIDMTSGLTYKIQTEAEVTVNGLEMTNNREYSIEVPDKVMINGNLYNVVSISDYAFYGCSGLTDINIPNSVKSIGNYAFYGCSGLTSINISNSVTSIGDCAFYG